MTLDSSEAGPLPRIPAHIPPERVVDFDLSNDPALAYDVFKRFEEIRDSWPSICYTPRNGGHWMVFERRHIEQVMKDAQTYSSAHLGRQNGGGDTGPGFIPLSLDPPEHTPWRALLLKHFGPAQIRQLEPFVRSWAERLISRLADRASCDFLKEVAEPMPVSVFMETMGLPLERFDEFRGLAVAALTPPMKPEDLPVVARTHARIMEVLGGLIADRKREPQLDLVSKLLADRIQDRPIADPEMMSMCYLLFLAGLDTVTNAMTYGIRHLAKNPQVQEEVRRDRALIPALVDKLLRLYTFVNTNRLIKHDTRLDGVELKAGEIVYCILWGGSNERGGDTQGVRHMAFGAGHHVCLGMHLARLELRVMYETWFDHIGRFSLVPDDNPSMRGGAVMNITRLLLNLEPLKAAA